LGRVLAEQTAPDDIDFVTYLPRCPESAARVYAEKIGKPFIPVFYKLNQERAFQGSNIGERANSIAHNLHLIDTVADQIRGKKGVIIDDSIVRGNNLVRARELMYEEARVAEAYLISYTPKIGIIGEDGIPRGCTFGVDMPPDDHFIARERSDAEISVKAGMPVRYLEREAMLRAFEDCGLDRKTLCTFCIGGPHPYKNIIPIGK